MIVTRKSPCQLVYEGVESTNRVIDLPVLDLHENEIGLDSGRFKHFTREKQELKVKLTLARDPEETRFMMRERVEWIARHTDEPWSMDVTYKSMEQPLEATFWFAETTAAVLFKLVWYD